MEYFKFQSEHEGLDYLIPVDEMIRTFSYLEDKQATNPNATHVCMVCGVGMMEEYEQSGYINSGLEQSYYERNLGLSAINGMRHCIVYNSVFGWEDHEPEEISNED